MSRRRLTLSDKVAILLGLTPCGICGEPLGCDAEIDWDHERALARGGTDTLDNIRPVHRDCHKRKTFGTGATTLGSDIHEAAKTKRLERKRLTPPPGFEVFGIQPNGEPVFTSIKPRPKIQGRGFDKGWRKPLRGPAERRE